MGSLYKRRKKNRKGEIKESPIWWIQYYRGTTKHRESSGSTRKADAVRLLAQREGQVAAGVVFNPRADRVLIGELFQDLLLDYRVQGLRSHPDAERRIRLHLEPFWSGSKAAFIRKLHIDRYITLRRRQAADSTINRELSLLRRSINLARESGKLNHPARISLLPEHNARSGFFTDEQIERVIQEMPENLRHMVRFAFLSGWRIRSEVLPLEWRQVDFAEGSVRLDAGKTKNRKPRLFPMTSQI